MPPEAELDLPDRSESVTITLVDSPPMHAHRYTACAELSSRCGENVDFFMVTFTLPGQSARRQWESAANTPDIENLAVLKLGTPSPTEAEIEQRFDPLAETVVSDRVPSPSNLTLCGIKTAEFLKKFYQSDYPLTICFDSVTALRQYADTPTVYEFLKTVIERAEKCNARIHFHIDSNAIDTEVISMLNSLCDEVVRFQDDTHGKQLSVRSSVQNS